MTGKFAVEEQIPQKISQQPEAAHTGTAQQTAIFHSEGDCFPDGISVSKGVIFRDNGQQQDGYGTGECIGKENERHRHTGQNTVDAQCRGGVIAVGAQLGRYGDGFYTLQKVQYNAVGG